MSDFSLSGLLCRWYDLNRRDLPWRHTRDPYLIWISEVILQQTRVDQGLDYYLRFTARFPDVLSLAEADEAEVLKYWQGLGYYSRARNLLAAARDVAFNRGGRFPVSLDEVRSLRGVGDYTAAAITSFAYDAPHAVVDGNVYRVLSRLLGIDTPIDTLRGKREFAQAAQLLLDPSHAATHNQAIMELGALVCTPASPDCVGCPLAGRCVALAEGRTSELPVKQGKTKVRDRRFHYMLFEYDGRTWLRRRPEGDIWAGLYEPVLVEGEIAIESPSSEESLLQVDSSLSDKSYSSVDSSSSDLSSALPVTIASLTPFFEKRHVLSHQRIHASFYRVRFSEAPQLPQEYIEVPIAEVERYPVSRLVHEALERIGW